MTSHHPTFETKGSKQASTLRVYDRENDTRIEEGVFAGGFLFWSYNSRFGLFLTRLLFRRRFVSELFGLYFKSPMSRKTIFRLIESTPVRLDELTRDVADFSSFNDFFTRDIDLSKRPITAEADVCVSPADIRILAYPSVAPDREFRIKRATFCLSRLVGSPRLTRRFAGGSMIVGRIHMADYHHFHFPDSGIPEKATNIAGTYYSVSPYPRRELLPFYGENRRMRTVFRSDHFGDILMVEIGGFVVGSIQQCYEPGRPVCKGSKKGYFQFGGSTIVLVFQPGVLELDEDLVTNTDDDVETLVRLGASIGRRQ